MPDRVVAARLLGDDELGADAVRSDGDAEVRRHLEHGGVVAGQRHDARGLARLDRPEHADERADRPVGGAHVDAGPCVGVSHGPDSGARRGRRRRARRATPPTATAAAAARARSPARWRASRRTAATPGGGFPARPLAHGGADEHGQADLPRQPRRLGAPEPARPRHRQGRAAARDARPERRALGEAEQEPVAPARVRRAAAGRRAVGDDQRRRAGEQSRCERAGRAQPAPRSAPGGAGPRPPAGTTAAASSAGRGRGQRFT